MATPKTLPLWTAAALAAALAIFPAAPASAQSSDKVLTARTFIDISRQALPAVVSVDVNLDLSPRMRREMNVESIEEFDEMLRRDGIEGLFEDGESMLEFFERFSPRDFGFQGSGSGVVVRREGDYAYAITNRHVVSEDARTRYSITLDSSYGRLPVKVEGDDVELVGVDSLTDLALLRFRIPEGVNDVPVMEFADSDAVEVGEWVLALGNPLDLNNSVSQGIISARNRSLTPNANEIENLLQTTAVINPGNSGGPLVNLDGKIVGINNAIKTQTGRWAGIGFAIPGNYAQHVADDLIEHGRVRRGYLGITMERIVPQRGSRTVVLPEVETTRNLLGRQQPAIRHGVLVTDVQPDTPASLADLRPGDVVIAVDGYEVDAPGMLLESVATRRVGESISLTVLRPESDALRELIASVTLMERPSEQELREMTQRRAVFQVLDERIGIAVEHSREGSEQGLRVTSVTPRSPADRAGLRSGDLITRINDRTIDRVSDLSFILQRLRPGDSAILMFKRNGASQTVTIDLPSE